MQHRFQSHHDGIDVSYTLCETKLALMVMFKWVNCPRDELLALSKRELGKVEGLNNRDHCHYPMFDDCEVEAHFLPTTIHKPF